MTEREWVECADPQEILKALRGKCSNRKLRLFSCACCRRIWQFITDPGSQAIVEIVEQCTDGLVDTQRILSLDWDRLTDNCGGPEESHAIAFMTAGHVGYSVLAPIRGMHPWNDFDDALSTAAERGSNYGSILHLA